MFDGSSWLSWNPSVNHTGDDFTFSLWAKPSVLDETLTIIEASGHGTDLYAGLHLIPRNSALRIGHWSDDGPNPGVQSSDRILRDTAAFYHLVWAYNSSAFTMYVNGVAITAYESSSNYASNDGINEYFNNSGSTHYLGARLSLIHI